MRTEQSLTLPREQGLAMTSVTEHTKSCNRSCRRTEATPMSPVLLWLSSQGEPLVGWWASPVLWAPRSRLSGRSPPFLHWQPLSLPSEDILKDTEKPPEKVTTLTGWRRRGARRRRRGARRRRQGARQRRREWEGDLSLALHQTFLILIHERFTSF